MAFSCVHPSVCATRIHQQQQSRLSHFWILIQMYSPSLHRVCLLVVLPATRPWMFIHLCFYELDVAAATSMCSPLQRG